RKRKTSSEDTTIRIRKRGIERRERDFKLREQEIKRTSDKSIKRRDLSKGHENAERSTKNHRSGRETQYYQGFDKPRSEEHTSELQSRFDIVCRLLLDKTKN